MLVGKDGKGRWPGQLSPVLFTRGAAEVVFPVIGVGIGLGTGDRGMGRLGVLES